MPDTRSATRKYVTLSVRYVAIAVLLLGTSAPSECATEESSSGKERQQRKRIPLTIGGFAEIDTTGIYGGGYNTGGVIPGMEMAIYDINQRDDILVDYELRLVVKDSKCDPGVMVAKLFEHLYEPPTKIMLIGGGCSQSTAPAAKAVPHFNLIEISYSASSPEYSEPQKFPTFFRTAPSAISLNMPAIRIMQYFNWRRIATIHESDEYYSIKMRHMHSLLKKENITLITGERFLVDPGPPLDNIQRKDARVILYDGYNWAARRLLCEAYKRNLYGARYQWMFPAWYPAGWMDIIDTDCTGDEIRIVTNCSFTWGYMNTDVSGLDTFMGMTYAEYEKRYLEWPSTKDYLFNNHHPNAYDAVVIIALALNETAEIIKHEMVPDGNNGYRAKRLDDFTYEDANMTALMMAAIRKSNFRGVSGPLAIDENKDRKAVTQLKQMVDGVQTLYALHYEIEDALVIQNGSVAQWNGDGPPLDAAIRIVLQVCVNNSIFLAACALAALGTIFATGLLTFNITHMKHRHIKMSSPRLNNIITVGCILGYISIVANGLDGRYVVQDHFHILCAARTWVLAIAFSLAFGAMFAKTYRVHAIFTSGSVRKKAALHDIHLIGMVGVLVAIDVIVMTAWQIADPMRIQISNGTSTETVTSITMEQTEFCEADYKFYWIGALYAKNGLLLLFGCFLAYQTRNVRVPGANDSKHIGISVYNTVVMCIVGVAITLVLYEQIDIAFIFSMFTTLVSSSLTLCLLFIPKVIHVLRNKIEDTSTSATFQYTMQDVKKKTGGGDDDDDDRWEELMEKKDKEIDALIKKLQALEKAVSKANGV